MRSIILTDEQHARLKVFIDKALTEDHYYMNEKLYREINDVKRCATCKHWNIKVKYCQSLDSFSLDVPEDGFVETELGESLYLSCWERK
jgi:hypothetical protein